MTKLKTWDLDDADTLSATDFIIGSTLGWWRSDEESLEKAMVVCLSQMFVQAGADSETAVDKAMEILFPADGEPDRTIDITVERKGDAYNLRFEFVDNLN